MVPEPPFGGSVAGKACLGLASQGTFRVQPDSWSIPTFFFISPHDECDGGVRTDRSMMELISGGAPRAGLCHGPSAAISGGTHPNRAELPVLPSRKARRQSQLPAGGFLSRHGRGWGRSLRPRNVLPMAWLCQRAPMEMVEPRPFRLPRPCTGISLFSNGLARPNDDSSDKNLPQPRARHRYIVNPHKKLLLNLKRICALAMLSPCESGSHCLRSRTAF